MCRSLAACVFSLFVFGGLTAPAPVVAAGKVDFGRDILPILSDNCFHCHGPDAKTRKADLRLDTREGTLGQPGSPGPVIPGKSEASELFQRLVSDDADLKMPPPRSNRKLTAAQIAVVRRWIDEGAEWGVHWAFAAAKRPDLPAVSQPGWVRNPIDRFVLARLDQEGLKPAPEASRETLLRRVSLDLTGLPPTPEETDSFLADTAPDAYERAVDRLLRSPRYGEKMVLDWLDAARYADSNGYQADGTRTLWPWRDWAVRALNANMPFDRFTVEQLAGDLLPGATLEQKIATGFHRNHMLNGEGGRIAEESRIDYVVDRVDTTASVWLGLTLGCARCHDHKYDPFSQKDYYRLFAYFNNIAEVGNVDRRGNANPVLPLPTPEQTRQEAQLVAEVAELEKQAKLPLPKAEFAPADWRRLAAVTLTTPLAPGLTGLPAAHLTALRDRGALAARLETKRKALENLRNSILVTMVMEERPQPRETFILVRGAWDKPGERVAAGVIESLAPLPKDAPANRLALAKWLVSPENPLTARVTVNRFWQTFFGTGLVKTAEDFGVQGEKPSHPELLDWLATEFVRTGWDMKGLVKLIVTSATYQQSSAVSAELRDRDPENRLLARGPRHRLPAMLLRDQATFVSGLLVEKLGGPPVRPYQPPGLWEEFSFGRIKYEQDRGPSLYRRSLYTFWRRTVGPPEIFDSASRQTCVVRPSRTNTPLHALTLLNDVTYVEASRVMAERVMKAAPSPEARLTLAFRLATARKPREAELGVLTAALQRVSRQYESDRDAAAKLVQVGESVPDPKLDVVELAAYTGVCSLVLNLDEVICKE